MLKRTSVYFKNVKLPFSNEAYAEPAAIFLTSGQNSPVTTADSNSFLSVFSKDYCSEAAKKVDAVYVRWNSAISP